jgi:GntR family transcriptional regulator
MHSWNPQKPIYQQVADLLAAGLLGGEPGEGEPMPSVRVLAAHYLLNPLTVNRALQALDEQGLIETRRGVGCYVLPGARQKLLTAERRRFLSEEWPRLRERLRQLNINAQQLEW